jgi:hypothetical protein
MERSIDELLNETSELPEAVTGDTVITPETVEGPTEGLAGEGEPPRLADEGQPRGPDGKFLPKQTGVEEVQAEPVAEAVPPAADQLPKDVYEPLKAVRNENRELKQQIAAIQAQFAQMQQQAPAKAQEPEPEFWDNPQAVIASQVQQAVMQALEAQKQQQTMERITESENAAKGRYADYDDAFLAFQQAATANPLLVKQMTAASDPAEFAYKTGKTALELSQVGSIDALLQRERAKWEAEARAAMPAPPALPSTTATDGSVGARTGPAWAGPAPIGDMLG